MARRTLVLSHLSLLPFAVVLLVGGAPAAQKHLLPSNEPHPRGLVTSHVPQVLALREHRLYLGGTELGTNCGSFAVTGVEGGRPDTGLPVFYTPAYAILGDGAGGWFVGGEHSVSSPADRATVVHVLADGTVDRSLPVPDGGLVRTMCRDGDILYIGGDFQFVGDVDREGLAAIDLATKQLLPWDPGAAANLDSYDIRTLAVMDGVVYIGGNFRNEWFGGQTWSYLAAVDGTSGDAVGSDIGITGAVIDIIAEDGYLILGGVISAVAGQPRDNVAIIEVATGLPTSFAPELDGPAYTLWRQGGVLYVGGSFDELNGLPRENLAAINLVSEQVLPLSLDFDGTSGTNLVLNDLHLADDVLYMAGHFLSIDGQERALFAAVDTSTGALTNWNPLANGESSPEGFAVAVQGNKAAIGGDIHMLGSVSSPGIAVIDLRTGGLEDWHPDLPNGSASAIAFGADGIYIGGSFVVDGPEPRAYLVRVDPETGEVDPTFDAGFEVTNESTVRRLRLNGDLLYIAGRFRRPGGQYRNLVAVEAATGNPIANWDTDIFGSVHAMAVPPNGRHLFLGGNFDTIGSAGGGWHDRYDLALVDAQTGEVLPWAPEMDDEVTDMVGVPGGLLVGGKFRHAGYQLQRRHAAIFDYPSGELREWSPDVTGGPSARVSEVGFQDGVVYLGGRFDQIAGEWIPYAGALDVNTATPLEWNAAVADEVYELAVGTRHVVIAGEFSRIGDLSIRHLAIFDLHALRSSVESISLAAGGTQPMDLAPGSKFAGCLYWMLGSLSGTDPGHWLEGYHVPLVRDDYYDYTWGNPGYAPLVGGVGFLDQHGEAVASLMVPPGSDPSLAGITVHHAAVVVDLNRMRMVTVTNALPLVLVE